MHNWVSCGSCTCGIFCFDSSLIWYKTLGSHLTPNMLHVCQLSCVITFPFSSCSEQVRLPECHPSGCPPPTQTQLWPWRWWGIYLRRRAVCATRWGETRLTPWLCSHGIQQRGGGYRWWDLHHWCEGGTAALRNIFWSPYFDKVSWRPNLNRTPCPDGARTVGHLTFRKENKRLWRKQEKLKLTSLTISPGTAAIMWRLIMNLLLVQL